MKSLALSVIALTLSVSADVVNLVRNPDFERLSPDGRSVGWENLPSCFHVESKAGENGSTGLVWENHDPKVQQFALQKLKLEPGRDYSLSMRLRTEGMQGGDGGASVRLFWYRPDGSFLKDTFVPGVKSEAGWSTVSCPSVKMPREAGSAAVAVYMNSGIVGKAFFDSVSVIRVLHRPVSGMWSDAYRDCRSKGKVTFVVGLDLEDVGLEPKDLAPAFRLPSGEEWDGKSRPPDLFNAREARLTLDVAELPLGESVIGFSMRSRKTGKVIPDAEAILVFDHAKIEPSSGVRIDASGRTVVDGRRFFPLGMFMNAETTPEVVKTYVEGPFNCVMNYHHPDLKALDLWHANGVKVLYPLQDAFTGTSAGFVSDEGAGWWFGDRIRAFRDHPAILAWYVNDERGLDYMPTLREHQRLARDLDPNHPTWSVLYQVADVSRYLGTFDVMGSDPYPIGNSDNLNQVWDWTIDTVEGCRRLFPVWQVPQAFDWGAYWPDKVNKTRMPTRDEMACMGWTAIAGGANGLIWYSYSPLVKMDKKTPFAKAWADVKAAAEEIARYIPVLLLDDAPGMVTVDSSDAKVRAWRKGRQLYALIVNLKRADLSVTLQVKDGVSRVEQLGPLKAKMLKL